MSWGEGPAWLRHSQFAAQKAKDAIVDRFRELQRHAAVGRPRQPRPADQPAPDARARLASAIDLSGEPLHRRGYRQSGVEAPLKENLAAALLLRCGWPAIAAAGGAFVDPMCGSGTLVIEAALMAADVAPGLLRRRFGFERWRQHQPQVWEALRAEALARRRLGGGRRPGASAATTATSGAIRAALANSGRCGVGDHIAVRAARSRAVPDSRRAARPGAGESAVRRAARGVATLEALYALLGGKLMECFPGWEAGVLTGNPPLGRALRLRAYRSHTFFNGADRMPAAALRAASPGRSSPIRRRRAARDSRRRARDRARRCSPTGCARTSRGSRPGRSAQDVACFRVYDADMPEYAFAIDLYGNDQRWACVQEYAAPATVAQDAARGRRDEVLAVLPEVLGLPAERVVLRVRRRQQRRRAVREGGRGGAVPRRCAKARYRFLVNFTDYLDTGLFLDHRLTRRRIGELAAGRSFLNLFAYTGTATVYAAGGGATASTTVDMSRTYLDWARRNLALNGLAGPQHGFVQADCLAWLEEQGAAPAQRYGLIFVDPPTLSRSKRMEREFDVQRDHARLLELAARLLEPGGLIVFSNNFQKFKLDPAVAAGVRGRGPGAGHAAGGFRAQSAHPCLLFAQARAARSKLAREGSATTGAVPSKETVMKHWIVPLMAALLAVGTAQADNDKGKGKQKDQDEGQDQGQYDNQYKDQRPAGPESRPGRVRVQSPANQRNLKGQDRKDYTEWCQSRGARYQYDYNRYGSESNCYQRANNKGLKGDKRANFLDKCFADTANTRRQEAQRTEPLGDLQGLHARERAPPAERAGGAQVRARARPLVPRRDPRAGPLDRTSAGSWTSQT